MTDTPSNVHHEINYIELYATNLTETKQFYAAAFGWKFNDYGEDYCGIQKQSGEGETGGICRVAQVQPGGPLVILYSNDLEASLASVVEAGGKVTQDIISFPGGRRFQFNDPNGVELAVWQPS